MTATSWRCLLKASFVSWREDKALRLSAALAYYATFSIAPLMVIAIGIAGLALGGEAATGQIYGSLKCYIGAQAAEGVQAMVKSASKPAHGIVASVAGFAMLMLGASGILAQLKDALNTVWEVKPKPGLGVMAFMRDKFLNFGMVLAIGFLMLVSLVMNSMLTAANHYFATLLILPPLVWAVIGLLISFSLTTLLLAMIFKFLPDARISFSTVWRGALITAALLEVGKAALGWYLGRESTANAYGAAGSVVLLLMWVYYTSCIVLFGAEFTQVQAKFTGHPIEPAEGAESLTQAERAEEGEHASDETARPQQAEVMSAPTRRHRFLEPLLRYIEGRMALLGLETKEALRQSVTLLLLAIAAAVSLFIIWLLLTTALIGFLTDSMGWGWVKAALVTALLHALVVGVTTGVFWSRFRAGVWFADTINELRKDRAWLTTRNQTK